MRPAGVLLLLICQGGLLRAARGAARPTGTPEIPPYMLHLLEENKPPADVVRSMTPSNIVLSDPVSSSGSREIQYLEFSVPGAGREERLEEAQLRIYAAVHHSHRLHGVERLLQVTLRSPFEEIKNSNIEATPTTLSHVYLKNNSWFSVNITNSFLHWSQLGENKLYVYLHVLNPYTSVGGAGRLQLLRHGASTTPLLLLMYDLVENKPVSTNKKHQQHSITRRSVQELEDYEEESNNVWDDDVITSKQTATQQRQDFTGMIISGKLAATRKKPHRNLCRRKPLYVDFSQIDYDSWIVAPAGYEAYQCSGKCFYPISEHLTPTKHAILQTLVHTVNPKRTARACCVPTRLQPISLLYLDQQGVLTYRFAFEDMVVAECGCR